MSTFNIGQWKETILLLILEGFLPSTELCNERKTSEARIMQSPFGLTHPLNPGATVQQEAQRAQRWVAGPQSTCLLQTLHTLVGQAHSGLQGLWGDCDTSGLQHSSTFLRAKRSVQERTSTRETVTSGALFAYKYEKTYWKLYSGKSHTYLTPYFLFPV